MKRVSKKLSCYSSDLFGVCSALYELGGLTVIHDASGCNSTYTTHDEPRWYDIPSMVYISALTESDAVMGNDSKLIEEICAAAKETKPNFIAITSSPLPMIMGTDLKGIAKLIEKRTGIPAFGFNTDGLKTYDKGISDALFKIAGRFCTREKFKTEKFSANIIGATPLDFSITGNIETLKKFFEKNGIEILSTWAMGSTLEEMAEGAAGADVNIVISASGIKAADYLKEKYGTPYVTGIPVGRKHSKDFIDMIKGRQYEAPVSIMPENITYGKTVIIAEPVFAESLRQCLYKDFGKTNVHIICPLSIHPDFLKNETQENFFTDEECEIEEIIKDADLVIADPLYKKICHKAFAAIPHEAYSGRIFRNEIPVFIGEAFCSWMEQFF